MSTTTAPDTTEPMEYTYRELIHANNPTETVPSDD